MGRSSRKSDTVFCQVGAAFCQNAHRYPMGKGAIPLFSYWNGEKLTYVEARKKIYIPLYYKAVKDTEAFDILKQKYDDLKAQEKDLYLVDFDAYRHKKMDMSYKEVVNCENRKMGHAFVLAMMLEEDKKLQSAIEKWGSHEPY